MYFGILASDALTRSCSFIGLHKDNCLLSNLSVSKISKVKTRTDEAPLARSHQSTGSICTPTTKTVDLPDSLPLGMLTGRNDKSTGLRDTHTPSRPRAKGVVKRFTKTCLHVLFSLPSHVAPHRTRIYGVCRHEEGRCNRGACVIWVFHLMNQYTGHAR